MSAGTGYALELKDLRKSFGKTEIIRGINLGIPAGERVGIIGPNGAGKSTLFNLISGRFEPSSGDVLLHGQRLNGKKPFEINRMGLSRSFQITNIFPKLSVFENLRCGVLWSLGYKYTFLKFLSARPKTTPMSCSTVNSVLPTVTSLISLMKRLVSDLLMPAVGSSSRMTLAPPAMVMPISSARCSA